MIFHSLLIASSHTWDTAVTRRDVYRTHLIWQHIKISDKISFTTLSVPPFSFTLIYANQTDESFADEFRFRIWKVANRNRLRMYASKTE